MQTSWYVLLSFCCLSLTRRQEGNEGILRLPADEPIVIAAVIAFIYTGELDIFGLKSIWYQFESLQIPVVHTFEIRTLTQVYVFADRLMMDTLRSTTFKRIVDWNGTTLQQRFSGR